VLGNGSQQLGIVFAEGWLGYCGSPGRPLSWYHPVNTGDGLGWHLHGRVKCSVVVAFWTKGEACVQESDFPASAGISAI
jgi:hypothetical protein